LPKEPSISLDQFQSSKNTTTNLKEPTAQARKEKVHPKLDQELKFATTYAPKLTSHAHVHQELALAMYAETESDYDFKKLTLLK
jgi:hypothetical protein